MRAFVARLGYVLVFFFFNDTATTEIYTLSLHDALPISHGWGRVVDGFRDGVRQHCLAADHRLPKDRNGSRMGARRRSEEHTSELQSRQYLVCRLLLEKKKNRKRTLLQYRHDHSSHAFLC